jgi:threonine aldolase
MASAVGGTTGSSDDPAVNRLQDMTVELGGRQAPLVVSTGTMCTQIAMHAVVRSGHLVICEQNAHAGRTQAASAAELDRDHLLLGAS